MKNKINLTVILQICGVFAVIFSMIWTTNASAVRPTITSLNYVGQILGGFKTVPLPPPLPGTAVVPLGSFYYDSTPDGNILVFGSTNSPSEFVPGVPENPALNSFNIENIFVRNLQTGETRCLSCQVGPFGLAGQGGTHASITSDGRYVSFSGMLPGATDIQVLRADLQTGNLDVVSMGLGGAFGNLTSFKPVISSDGRYVAFYSKATNLVAGFQGTNAYEVFVRDMQTGQTFLASHAVGSTTTAGNVAVDSVQPLSISDNGRFVVWTSMASNYLPLISDNNNAHDVYFFDALGQSGLNIGLASFSSTTTGTGNGASTGGVIAKGSASFPPTIIFASNATNLHPADANANADIYCYKGETLPRLVSIARDGAAANATSSSYTITRDGRFVAFTSLASNLVNGIDEATNTTNDVFLRDLQSNSTRYVSLNANNTPSTTNAGAKVSDITDDARYISFYTSEPVSVRDNLNTQDSYVRDMTTGIPILVTLNKTLTGGQNGNAYGAVLRAGGRKVFFTATGTNLFAGDTTTTQNFKIGEARISLLASRSIIDINGDAKNDFAVFRPSEGNWYSLLDAASGEYSQVLFGESGGRVAPGDYDGDGETDHAIFDPVFGRWDILQSSNGELVTKFFGMGSDIIAPADFDGDGKTDLAFFRPSNATWYVLHSNTGSFRSVKFGLNGDVPVVGDYDSDNRADIAIFRPSSGDWWILRSSNNGVYSFHWGSSGDKPVVGDYDGDGKSDAAIFRGGIWYITNSRDGSYYKLQFGVSDDRPVVSDYDGDGKTDVAVYRPSTNFWYVLKSSDDSWIVVQWGTGGDVPVASAYVP